MKKLEQLICIFCVFWLACSSAIVVGQTEKEHETQAEKIAAGENFSRDKLVVWCIVPFDAKNRGPAERAIMVKELGLTRVAYDWRQKHKKEFEQEIIEYKKNGLEYFCFLEVGFFNGSVDKKAWHHAASLAELSRTTTKRCNATTKD